MVTFSRLFEPRVILLKALDLGRKKCVFPEDLGVPLVWFSPTTLDGLSHECPWGQSCCLQSLGP